MLNATNEDTNSEKSFPLPGNPIRMYTTHWCSDCFRAKKILQSMQFQFEEIDITNDEDATEMVIRMNNGHRSVPTLVFPDGSILTEPSTVALVQKLQSLS